MKTYTLDEIIENYRADIDEFVCDEYVPAEVAQRLYDEMKNMVALMDGNKFVKPNAIERCRAALAAANGEDQ